MYVCGARGVRLWGNFRFKVKGYGARGVCLWGLRRTNIGLLFVTSKYMITKPKTHHFVQLGVCLWGLRCTNMGASPQSSEFVSKITVTYRLQALNDGSIRDSEMAQGVCLWGSCFHLARSPIERTKQKNLHSNE